MPVSAVTNDSLKYGSALSTSSPPTTKKAPSRFHILDSLQTRKLSDLLNSDMLVHPQGPNAQLFPTLRIGLREAVECVRDKLLLYSDIQILDIRVNGGAASYIVANSDSDSNDPINQDPPVNSVNHCQLTSENPLKNGATSLPPPHLSFNDLDLIFFVKLNSSRDMERIKNAVLEMLYSLFVKTYHESSASKTTTPSTPSTTAHIDQRLNGNETLLAPVATVRSESVSRQSEPTSATTGLEVGEEEEEDADSARSVCSSYQTEDLSSEDAIVVNNSLQRGEAVESLSVSCFQVGSPGKKVATASLGGSSSSKDSGCGLEEEACSVSPIHSPSLTPPLPAYDESLGEKHIHGNVQIQIPNQPYFTHLPSMGPGSHCYVNRSLLREVYVHKMVKVCSSGDLWSLIALSNREGRNLEFKFVSSMKRQFEFSVDSFQIILDPLLHKPFAANNVTETSAVNELSSESRAEEIRCESVFGDFDMALSHLRHRLISTVRPEEIRGGGLLKYCHLLIQGFRPDVKVDVRSLEKYMCSRFFIDFGDLHKQRLKLDSYLRNHFSLKENPRSLHGYLLTLYRVVDESTVCLMGHERREILKLIEKLFYDVYYNNVYQLAPNVRATDHLCFTPSANNSTHTNQHDYHHYQQHQQQQPSYVNYSYMPPVMTFPPQQTQQPKIMVNGNNNYDEYYKDQSREACHVTATQISCPPSGGNYIQNTENSKYYNNPETKSDQYYPNNPNYHQNFRGALFPNETPNNQHQSSHYKLTTEPCKAPNNHDLTKRQLDQVKSTQVVLLNHYQQHQLSSSIIPPTQSISCEEGMPEQMLPQQKLNASVAVYPHPSYSDARSSVKPATGTSPCIQPNQLNNHIGIGPVQFSLPPPSVTTMRNNVSCFNTQDCAAPIILIPATGFMSAYPANSHLHPNNTRDVVTAKQCTPISAAAPSNAYTYYYIQNNVAAVPPFVNGGSGFGLVPIVQQQSPNVNNQTAPTFAYCYVIPTLFHNHPVVRVPSPKAYKPYDNNNSRPVNNVQQSPDKQTNVSCSSSVFESNDTSGSSGGLRDFGSLKLEQTLHPNAIVIEPAGTRVSSTTCDEIECSRL